MLNHHITNRVKVGISQVKSMPSSAAAAVLASALATLPPATLSEFYASLSHYLHIGQWPQPDDAPIEFDCSTHWNGRFHRYYLRRRITASGYYWYMLSPTINGQRLEKYIGKNLTEKRLLEVEQQLLSQLGNQST